MVFPKPSDAAWHGDALATFTNELRRISGSDARPAGSIPLSADIISSISRDGPLATLAALAGVILLVTAIFRFNRSTLLIIGSLLLGVLWLTAATLVLKVKVNFCNFIAFPITFGIGVDYAVNVMARYRQTGEKDVIEAIRSTGGAVALCSMTTIIGYGSLLLATNRALFLFGLVAVLGELCCLATAVVVLPAVLASWAKRRDRNAGAAVPLAALQGSAVRVADAQPLARGPESSLMYATHAIALLQRSTFAVTRRRIGHQVRDQLARGLRDLLDSAVELHLIALRRLRHAAHLAHVLQRSRSNLLFSSRRRKIK